MGDVLEIFADTGERIERGFTPEEQAQRDVDAAAYAAAQIDIKAKTAATAATRKAAIEHAKSLGFTDEMISVMYPTLVEE